MNKYFLIIIGFILISLNSKGQKQKSVAEEFMNSVVYIYNTTTQTEKINNAVYEVWLRDSRTNKLFPKEQNSSGSGFLIHTDNDFYLVTASHVAVNINEKTKIIVSGENDSSIVIPLKDILFDKSAIQATTHPHADVSVFRLNGTEFDKFHGGLFVPSKMILFEYECPQREYNLTLCGYPLGLGIGKKISPITKNAKPASGLMEITRFDTKQSTIMYLLENESVSGFSGGPVFFFPQNIVSDKHFIYFKSYKIAGLVHGTINDKGSGVFAAVVPAKFIIETIESAPGVTGTITYKYDNGSLWSQRYYKNGLPWTVISNFDKNGKPQDMGDLKNGTGILKTYDSDGKLIYTETYKNGSLIDLK